MVVMSGEVNLTSVGKSIASQHGENKEKRERAVCMKRWL